MPSILSSHFSLKGALCSTSSESGSSILVLDRRGDARRKFEIAAERGAVRFSMCDSQSGGKLGVR